MMELNPERHLAGKEHGGNMSLHMHLEVNQWERYILGKAECILTVGRIRCFANELS